MYGYFGEIELYLPASNSLKDRRKIINSIRDRMHNINVSVADVSQDLLWRKAHLVFAVVASNAASLDQTANRIDHLLSTYDELEVILFYYDSIQSLDNT